VQHKDINPFNLTCKYPVAQSLCTNAKRSAFHSLDTLVSTKRYSCRFRCILPWRVKDCAAIQQAGVSFACVLTPIGDCHLPTNPFAQGVFLAKYPWREPRKRANLIFPSDSVHGVAVQGASNQATRAQRSRLLAYFAPQVMKKVLKKTIKPQSSTKNSKRVVGLLQRKAMYTFTDRMKLQAVRA
jgi:hypothetical protein